MQGDAWLFDYLKRKIDECAKAVEVASDLGDWERQTTLEIAYMKLLGRIISVQGRLEASKMTH